MTRIASFAESLETLIRDDGPTEEIIEQDEATSNKIEEDEISFEEDNEDNVLWRMNIFTLYARVFRVMLAKWKETMKNTHEDDKSRELDNLILPSNEEWRYQVYYRLVDLQREIDLGNAENTSQMNEHEPEMEMKKRKNWDWEPVKRDYPIRPKSGNADASIASLALAINDTNGSMTEACIEPGWRVSDIILAAQVLQDDSPSPIYKDEAEMRRVFGLVYDVLRYKQILNQALQDVGFWYRYNEYRNRERIVWLLLYDMQGRKFSRRGDTSVVESRDQAFRDAEIKDIEDALLDTKTHLAASVSRLRIGGSALGLDELLPAHLRTAEGVIWGENGASIASGWVNTIKVSSKAEFVGEMAKLEMRLCLNCNETELDENHYVFDPVCPKVVNLHDKAREKLAMSDLVTSHRFIFLERSLCLGAAALAQTIRCGRLCGPVVLTHSIAPRHTAYLAGLIADIEDAGKLLAFGTGEERSHYEEYLDKLGVTPQQCRVFSERYVSPPSLPELERATIVLASPPCSYTGVKDVVDLAVARGGDTKLLETLTNIDIELDHPKALLTEQLTTLKYALTRPNVQLLVYEAHSILPSETFEMVQQVVQHANQMATDKYSREHPPKKIKQSSKESVTRASKSGRGGKRGQSQDLKIEDEKKIEEEEETIRVSVDLEVPESDLFVIGSATELYGRESAKFLNDGCYLAVIKRKEMMQFNSLFMIKVAESKGLFGDPNKQQQPKEEQTFASPIRQGSQQSIRKNSKRPKIQLDRVAAGTHSSIVRSARGKKEDKNALCPRHSNHVAQDERSSIDKISNPFPSQSSRLSRLSSGSSTRQLTLQRKQSENKKIMNISKSIRPILNEKIVKKDLNVIHLSSDQANQLQSFSFENTIYGTSAWQNRSRNDEDTLSLASKEYRNSSTFCLGHGPWALAHATQKISLDNLMDERDKENSSKFPSSQQIFSGSFGNNKSRLYHPGGSLRFSRLETSSNPLPKSLEYFQRFPYLSPGIGNAAAAAGLDNSPNN